MNVPCFRQERNYTCAVACLRMVLAYHHQTFTEPDLAVRCQTTEDGTTAHNVVRTAEALGFQGVILEGDLTLLEACLASELPVITYLRTAPLADMFGFDGIHAVVVTGLDESFVHFNDPWTGSSLACPLEDFMQAWTLVSNLAILIW